MQIIYQILNEIENGSKLDTIAKLIEYGEIGNHTGDDGQTLLMSSCRSGRADLVEYLVKEQEVFIDQKDHFGRTALMFAASHGSYKNC